MYHIDISKSARKDIVSAIDWYNIKKQDLGYQFLEELNDYIQVLKDKPNAFPVKHFPYHEFPLKRFPYIVVYIIQKKQVIIKAVLSAKKLPSKKYRK